MDLIMPSLLDLSLEILEMVVLQLESVEDVISMGSSCSRLARLVGQKRLWRGTRPCKGLVV